MISSRATVCIALPSEPAYSETFLQAHIDRLASAVSYLPDYPVDLSRLLSQESIADAGDQVRQKARMCWHRFYLNPVKKRSLKKLFRLHKINILLAEYGLTGIAVLDICKDLNIPLVVHFHGSDAYSIDVIEEHRLAYQDLFDYASAIIAASRHMEEQLVKLGAPGEKVFYNPYGVEINKFHRADVLSSPLRVLSVGRFVEKKAPYLTILAFAKVLQRLPEARLVMVGGGLLHDVCSKLIKAMHIEHAVELKGILNHEKVAALMQRSRVFVQHSLMPASGDAEGTPVAILEAGAAGLPVVSTKHAGISEVVINAKTGFLVDEGDVDNMAESIYRLLANPELAREMSRNAREHIAVSFNMDQSIERLRILLESCVTNGVTGYDVPSQVISDRRPAVSLEK